MTAKSNNGMHPTRLSEVLIHVEACGRVMPSVGLLPSQFVISTMFAQIKERLLSLQKSLHPNYKFPLGADKHRYQLHPPISQIALRSFEETHRISLPEDYREFLLQVGDGGAGPYYGLLALEQWDEALWREVDDPISSDPKVNLLASESPLSPAVEYKDDWERAIVDVEHGPYQGAVTLCHQGCTYYSIIIVTGAHRGRVVNIDEDMQPPKFSPHPDFFSWYDGWVDLAMRNEVPGWYGYPKR